MLFSFPHLCPTGMPRSDTTQLTVSSLNESQGNVSETELQPEDQDEELEMALRSHGTLVELYPSMISRIERAWHRNNVSEAADTVLRRYRRWRQQSNRSHINNTFIVTLRQANSKPRKMSRKMLLKEDTPEKGQFMGTEHAPQSPLQTVTNLQDWEAQQQSPGRERALWRREQRQPILAMDLSEASGKASLDWSLRARRLSLSAPLEQATGRSVYASEATSLKERPDIYSSPVRQSPSKVRMITGFSGSPHSFSRSPREYSVESFSRETTRPRSLSTSLYSPLGKPTGDLRMLYPQDSSHSLQLHSSQSAREGHRLRLWRHLSFDSSQPSFHVSCSPKVLDEDFKKLYHKLVCKNKSFLNGPPCRFCAENSETSQGHSSSALAALALSPHRSVLRKRHRELGWDSHPQSKRSREECYAYSPGSKRHRKEMLRRCLSPSELEKSHYDFSHSSNKHVFERVGTQQRSADTWMSRGRHLSAAESSGLGKLPPEYLSAVLIFFSLSVITDSLSNHCASFNRRYT